MGVLSMFFLRGTVAVVLISLGAYSYAGSIHCPKGTTPNGESTPDVSEAWCEKTVSGSTVMHGPYRAWWPNGKLGTVGQYENGVTEGKWSGWYPNGRLQGHEWFKAGNLVRGQYWDESGKPMKKPPNPTVNPDLAHKAAQGWLPPHS